MGTYSGYSSRRELVNELLATQSTPSYSRYVMAHCFVGNNLWSVIELKREGKQDCKFIALDLISRFGPENWAYKPLSEDMGPMELSCPLKYFELAPLNENGIDTSHAREWRERVKAFWQQRHNSIAFAATLARGDKFTSRSTNDEFTFLYVYKKNWIVGELQNGKIYKVNKNDVAPIACEVLAELGHS